MKRRQAAILILAGGSLAIGLLSGCKRETRSPPAAPPTTRVAATVPAAVAVIDEPLPATFVINNQSFTFPAAKLVTLEKDGKVRVTLFSDDPPEAVRDGYSGNSFYFRFTLDANTAADLAGQQFVYRNSFTDEDETTSGLFIAGGRQTLRPIDASVSFDRLDGQVLVQVGGTFRLLDEQKDDGPPMIVKVRASLEPGEVAAKK